MPSRFQDSAESTCVIHAGHQFILFDGSYRNRAAANPDELRDFEHFRGFSGVGDNEGERVFGVGWRSSSS